MAKHELTVRDHTKANMENFGSSNVYQMYLRHVTLIGEVSFFSVPQASLLTPDEI